MEKNNPYASPTAFVGDRENEEGFGDLKIFTSEGRLGRIRYLLYTIGVGLVGMMLAAVLTFIPIVGPILALVLYIGIIVVTILLTIQRSHDFNTTGWMSLALLIPIASLIFYFIPGTKGSNNYGLQPPPNSKAVKVTAFLLLALFVVIILAFFVLG